METFNLDYTSRKYIRDILFHQEEILLTNTFTLKHYH